MSSTNTPKKKIEAKVVHTEEAKKKAAAILEQKEMEAAAVDTLLSLKKTPNKGGYILSKRTRSRSKSRSRRTRSKRRVSRAKTTKNLNKYDWAKN